MNTSTATLIYTVEVFKTNVLTPASAKEIIRNLLLHFPGARINFDLQDCDRVLRLEGYGLEATRIKNLLEHQGFLCQDLEG